MIVGVFIDDILALKPNSSYEAPDDDGRHY